MSSQAPERAVIGAVVGLGRVLRDGGIATSVDRELVLCQALAEVDLRSRDDVYWAARSVLLSNPTEIFTFDRIFERFWAGIAMVEGEAIAEHGESDPRVAGPQHGGESLPQFRREGRGGSVLDANAVRSSAEIPSAGSDDQDGPDNKNRQRGVMAAYSPDEVLNEQEKLGYGLDELVAVRRLAEELRIAVPERRFRRHRPSRRRGRLDVRRTLRRSLKTEGEPLRPAYASHSRTPRRLLLLCDVSGSMERYSRAVLAALQAVIGSGVKAETFVFATRLTRLTGPLNGRDTGRALEKARAAVPDWSGGTRIGYNLAEFNKTFARRGLARGAIAIIVSDGWDRGDPELLARELRRLQLQVRRLVWINPRPVSLGNQPLAVGMQVAMPFVDDFVPGHDPRAVEGLARVIGGLGERRPQRKRAPQNAQNGRLAGL